MSVLDNPSNPHNQKLPNEYSMLTRRPILVYILLVLIVLGYISFSGWELLLFGNHRPAVEAGQIWRFFSSMFLHIDLPHLLFNGIALIIFGIRAERIFGHWRFMVIYLMSGLFGSLFSFSFGNALVSVGASGAIFGLIGANVVYFYLYKDHLGEWGKNNLGYAVGILIANIIYGLVKPNIDNWAHFGGLVAGMSLAYFLLPYYQQPNENKLTEKWVDTSERFRHTVVFISAVFIFGLTTWIAVPIYPKAFASQISFISRQLFTSESPVVNISPQITLDSDREIKKITFSTDSTLLGIATGTPIIVTHESESEVGVLIKRKIVSQITSVDSSRPSDVQLWRLNDGILLKRFTGSTDAFVSVAINQDNTLLAAGNYNSVLVWDINSEQRISYLRTDGAPNVFFSLDGNLLVAKEYRAIKLWHVGNCGNTPESCFTALPSIGENRDRAYSMALSPKADIVALGTCAEQDSSFKCHKGEIRLWQIRDNTLERVLEEHTKSVTSIIFSPDGNILASVACLHNATPRDCPESEVIFWDVNSGTLINKIITASGVTSITFSPDGTLLAVGLKNSRVIIKETSACSSQPETCGRILGALNGHEDRIKDVAFSPDGELLATASEDGIVQIWNVSDLNFD